MAAQRQRPIAADPDVIRVGNCSGFYGDRLAAMREMLTGGELDVLTGDYLSELTMLILGRDRARDPGLGYARTFLRQLEDCLGLAVDRGVRIVANAGGLNPAGLAARLRELADRLGVAAAIGYVEGDDLTARAAELGFGAPVAANAYLGAWGIVACLRAGADVVVAGRVTDASLAVGPAAAHFGWGRADYDRLAGAVAAGHVLECGAQATGGNYAFFTEIADPARPGFPIAEISRDGSSVITKHPGTGGAVTVGTVTAQLVYEIQGARYPGPDVTTRLDTVELAPDGPDRVRISGTRGEPPPPGLKVSLNRIGGFRNEVGFVLTGLDIPAKAALARRQLEAALGRRPAELSWTLARLDRPDADTEEQASAILRCVARDRDPDVVGRAFSGAAVELALASYPGFHLTAVPGNGSPFGIFSAGHVHAGEVRHVAVLPDGTRTDVPAAAETLELQDLPDPPAPPPLPGGPARLAPLGVIAAARSGDKGGDANVGVWVRTAAQWRWLVHALTVDRLRELLPETAGLPVTRTALPRLRALIEEAPSPLAEQIPGLRERLFRAARLAAGAIGYTGAGTVEFLADANGDFFFLEMNTRLQVEHPVTENTAGLDLVRLQLQVAAGHALPATPPAPRGHSIEARLYAEDPARDWRPQAGTVHRLAVPGAATDFAALTEPGVRLDSGVVDGTEVSVHYDPMLAKVISYGRDRAEAARLLAAALARARIHGLVTNRDLLVRVLRHDAFLAGETDTAFLDRHGLGALARPLADDRAVELAAVAAALAEAAGNRRAAAVNAGIPAGWRNLPSQPQSKTYAAPSGRDIEVRYLPGRTGVAVEGHPGLAPVAAAPDRVVLDVPGAHGPVRRTFDVARYGDLVCVDSPLGPVSLTRRPRFTDRAAAAAAGSLLAPMPGSVVRLGASRGDRVARGQPILWLEAMKMEHAVAAPADGVLTELTVAVGQQVGTGTVLARVETEGAR